jgi:hypothetical protein
MLAGAVISVQGVMASLDMHVCIYMYLTESSWTGVLKVCIAILSVFAHGIAWNKCFTHSILTVK